MKVQWEVEGELEGWNGFGITKLMGIETKLKDGTSRGKFRGDIVSKLFYGELWKHFWG